MIGSGSVLLIGSASVVAIRGTAAVSAGQARAGGWPMATIQLKVGGTAEPDGTVVRDLELLGCHWIIRTG